MQASQVFAQLQVTQGDACVFFLGDDPELHGLQDLAVAQPGQLSYVEGPGAYARLVPTTQASALILPLKLVDLQEQATARGVAWIAVPQPRLAFAQAIALFYQPFRPAPGVHPSAVVDSSVRLGEGVCIGPRAVIQGDCTLGDGVCVHANVVIYPGVRIGDRTILHANCTIQERTQIGADCIIQSGAVIGSDGFGFVPTAQGWVKMEQSGHVVLEDQVEIGANSTVDRPAVGETRIGRDTKLDNLVHVGHGCTIGRGCAMAAQVGLAGGVELGNGVILAGQVGVANRAKVGDRATVASKGGVHNDIEAGAVVSGYPAVAHQTWLRAATLYNRLPEIYRKLQRIQKHLGLQDEPK